jgi:hypothetical protein
MAARLLRAMDRLRAAKIVIGEPFFYAKNVMDSMARDRAARRPARRSGPDTGFFAAIRHGSSFAVPRAGP